MTYYLVSFPKEENKLAVIHKTWKVSATTCKWPNKDVEKALRKAISPMPEWPTCDCRFLKPKNGFGTLAEGKVALQENLVVTELSDVSDTQSEGDDESDTEVQQPIKKVKITNENPKKDSVEEGSSSVASQSSISTEDFQKLQKDVSEIKNILKVVVIPTLTELGRKPTRPALEEDSEELPVFDFPISTINQLVAFHEKATAADGAEFKKRVRRFLRHYKGSNIKESTKRMLDATIATIVGKDFSWEGYRSGKQPFNQLELVKIMSEVLEKQDTKSNVEARFKAWLKAAHSEHHASTSSASTSNEQKTPKRKLKQKTLSFASLLQRQANTLQRQTETDTVETIDEDVNDA